MSIFADNLRILRQSKGLSQEKLAIELGLNRGNIASYEKGSAEPSMKNLYAIVKYFNIELKDLMEGPINVNANSDHGRPPSSLPRLELLQELRHNQERLLNYKEQTDSMKSILDGFRQFHQFKKRSNTEISDEVRQISDDYEKLLDLMETVINSNKDLVNILSGNENQED